MLHFPVCCHDTVTSSSSSTKERIRRRGIGEGSNSYSGLAHLEAGVNWKAMETWLCDLDKEKAVQLELFTKQDFHHGDQQVILDHGRHANH